MDKTDDKKNDKITEFVKKKPASSFYGKNLPVEEGFPYLILKEDMNGFNFNPKHLEAYAATNKYTITIAIQEDKKTLLYNYFVDNDDLTAFFKAYNDGKINGNIIEIDKFNPEILA